MYRFAANYQGDRDRKTFPGLFQCPGEVVAVARLDALGTSTTPSISLTSSWPGWPTSGRSWAPMRRRDRATLLPTDFQFILAEVTCHYRSPATLDDQLAVSIWVGRMGRKSFVFEYRINDEGTGRLVAEGCSTQVWFDYAATESRPVPAEIVARMENMQGTPIAAVKDTSGVRRQESGVSQRKRVRLSPAAAAHRPTRTSPRPYLPASPRRCRTPRRAAPSRSHRSHRTTPTAGPPMSHRPRQRAPREHRRRDQPSPARRRRPAAARRAPRVRQTMGAGGVAGARRSPVGAPRPRAPRRWILAAPKPEPLPRCWA